MSQKRGGGGARNATINMTEVKLKHGFLKRSNPQLVTLNQNDINKRKPFDINAIGDNIEVVSFENNKFAGANRTSGTSFYKSGMNVLGPIISKKFQSGSGEFSMTDLNEMPNGVGRLGKNMKTPSRRQEDVIRNELSLI